MMKVRAILIIGLLVSFFEIRAQYFLNPILAGFYPDPSICRAGRDYYIVNSSFAYYPGLPIFHSKDLVNWRLIGHAMDRPSQLNLDGAGVSRGLFAPSISYFNGTFYIVCTLIDKLGNFVITATDPEGPWSDPVPIPEVNGIDPSLFFDNDGSCYILYNSIPPDNKPLHDGHRTIRMREFDPVNLRVIGEEKLLINGGTDMAKKPVWIEGPHIIKKDGWYYLICAEGGTGYNHSEVVFRSKSINGPFVSYEKNPILTQRNLDPNRKDPVTTTGHADFIETPEGNWYAVFLGCRPYEDDYYNTGRETFMTPVEWKNGWPIINPGFETIQYKYPINTPNYSYREPFNGNYFFYDEFHQEFLNMRYSFLRTVRRKWFELDGRGQLAMELRPETCQGTGNPSFIAFRQPHLNGWASTTIDFEAQAENEKAGLMVFQNETHYYYICISMKGKDRVVELYKGAGGKDNSEPPILVASDKLKSGKNKSVVLIISTTPAGYTFYYSVQRHKEVQLGPELDAKFLSTKTAGGFVGAMYVLYATSNGKESKNRAYFERFKCYNGDHVYD